VEELPKFARGEGVVSSVLEVGWIRTPRVGVESCPVDRGGGAGVGVGESGL